ncbi:MAG: hypothetical protein WBQ17_13345 [Rhizomicrobium sp.]
MRSRAIALCGAFVMLTLPAFAQSAPTDFKAQIEQCLRQNAPKVEAAIPDLKQGVDFLLNEVCAVPVAAETERKTQAFEEASNARYQKMCDQEKAGQKNNSAGSANRAQLYGCTMAGVTKIGIVNTTQYVGNDDADGSPNYFPQASPEMNALAASLLLDLRLAHQKSEAPH